MKTVICARCESHHDAFSEGSSQGYDCAVEVYGDRAYGGYGSRHDLTSFAIHKDAKLTHGAVLCENCVDDLVESGLLDGQREEDIIGDPVILAAGTFVDLKRWLDG